jgi:hypothetical protein
VNTEQAISKIKHMPGAYFKSLYELSLDSNQTESARTDYRLAREETEGSQY